MNLQFALLLQSFPIAKTWAAAGFVDTTLRSFRLSFELHRTEIPQR